MIKPIKVLVLADGIGPQAARGVEVIFQTLKELRKHKVEITLLTSIDVFTNIKKWDEWKTEQENELKIKIESIDWSSLSRVFFAIWFSKILTFFKAIQLIKSQKFDIIHEYSSSPLLYLRTFILGKLGHAKSVHTIIASNTSLLAHPIFGILGNLLDKVIFTSQAYSKKYTPFIRKDKTAVILPGINLKTFANPPLSGKRKTILYLGPMEISKGVLLLSRAVREVLRIYPDAFFLFVFYRKTVRENYDLTLPKLKMILNGLEDHYSLRKEFVNVAHLYKSVDLVVVPQITPHGTIIPPLTLIEAMAAGKVVVAPRSSEISDLVKDGITGFTFSSNDSHSLSQSLIRGLRSKTKIGYSAQSLISKEYSIQNNTAKLFHLYEKTS